MNISCYLRDEKQLFRIVMALREAGFSDEYEEEAHGETLLLTVHTRTVDQRVRVREILRSEGISELIYNEDAVA